MKHLLYSAEGFTLQTYDDELNVIFATWWNYTTKVHVRKALEAQLNAMEEFGARVIIADSQDAIGIPYPEDREWFQEVLYPECKRLGLEVVVCVVAKNTIARLGTREWKYIELTFGIKYVEVNSMEEAMQYLESHQKMSTI